jgi:rRNA maturation endonuclease Nob1
MVLKRLRRLTGHTYQCEGCRLGFDREYGSCPACGFEVIEAA